jgi:eukaryotic translation initiation factor 2C
MYQISSIVCNPEPVTPIHGARSDQVEKAQKNLYKEVTNELKGKELELPVDISPKSSGRSQRYFTGKFVKHGS